MNQKTMIPTGFLVVGLWLAGSGASWGQHRPHHHKFWDYVTQYHYRYMVPSSPQYGSYYTHENIHYYTPPAPAPVTGQPWVAPRPVSLEFGAFKHYQELAQRLETVTNQFCLDLHYNYQHNRNFRRTYREAYELLDAVKHLHGNEHHRDRDAIRRSARRIDSLFHDVQGDVRTWSRVQNRQVGRHGIGSKLDEMESLIHHLMFDVGVTPDHDRDEAAPPPHDEVAPPPGRSPLPRRAG
jgi:hypothetical protein